MAREGLGINNQFRVNIGLPLDSREKVKNLTELIAPSTWYADDNNSTYLWKGMRTYVESEESWYELTVDPTQEWQGHQGQYAYENIDNWKNISAGGSGVDFDRITNEQIDTLFVGVTNVEETQEQIDPDDTETPSSEQENLVQPNFTRSLSSTISTCGTSSSTNSITSFGLGDEDDMPQPPQNP